MSTNSSGPGPMRVAIVEDNRLNRELLVKILGRWGYTEVDSLSDPRDFMDLFRRKRHSLIFLDFRMPYLSGQELLEKLRQEPGALERCRVVMLTGDSGAELTAEVLERGASAVLTKPFVLKELKGLVDRLVGELRGHEATG